MENNKIKKEINDVVNDNLKALERLFPSAVKDGQLDIKALKEELGDFEEVGIERYELNWAGKQKAKKMAQQGIGNKTLKFVAKDSKNADTTENIYIEGDNLEVLKLLRQNYYNSIKMIYIDPPYNTGNDFVYNDTFKKDGDESDKEEGYKDETGKRLEKNPRSTNRYHAKWLDMMYPRLKLARDLLTDDGVIFISIDDNEQANLKRLCDEIFGEKNFVSELIWKSKSGGANDSRFFATDHEYVIVFAKNSNNLVINIDKNAIVTTIYNQKDEKGSYSLDRLDKQSIRYSKSLDYEIKDEKGNSYYPKHKDIKKPNATWRWSKETVKQRYDELVFKDGNVYTKNYKKEGSIARSLLIDERFGRTRTGKTDFTSLFDRPYFSAPKPHKLILYFLDISIEKYDIILDFFSGSATTAHAVMQLNSEDNGNRKYIMVQLPETTDEKSEAFKAGYKNIAEIGKERIRRAGEKIKQEIEEYNSNLKLGEEPKKVPDIGFKVFKVDNTNIKWYDLENFNEESQYSFDDPDSLDFVLGSNDIDIVYEIMLRQNDIPLSESLEVLTDIGNRTYLYASTYLICLEIEITEEMVEKLASLEPLPIKFIFRDSAFKDNISLKDETFRKLRSLIERNSGESKVSYRVEFI